MQYLATKVIELNIDSVASFTCLGPIRESKMISLVEPRKKKGRIQDAAALYSHLEHQCYEILPGFCHSKKYQLQKWVALHYPVVYAQTPTMLIIINHTQNDPNLIRDELNALAMDKQALGQEAIVVTIPLDKKPPTTLLPRMRSAHCSKGSRKCFWKLCWRSFPA